MRHVKVVLEYFHPWTNSAGFYLARHQGWYRGLGLDVELAVFDPERGDTLAYLARREADFGIFPTNRLFVQREQGQALTAIAAINHRGLETIQTLTTTGIKRPRDLAGRRLALNPTPRGLAMVRHLVASDGGDPDAIVIVDSGLREFSAEQIAGGEVDASFGSYWAWEALMDSSVPPAQRVSWPVDEIGAPPYHSYLLGAHDSLLHSEPELVRDFLAATERGYVLAASNPELAVPLYERVAPYLPRSLIRRSLPLIADTWLHEGRWGCQREELLAPYAEWLSKYGILSDPDIWRQATRNDFLPEAQALVNG